MKAIKRFFTGVSVACVSLVSVGAANAATITGVTASGTTGSQMNGMEVTVNFQGGTTSTAIFNSTGIRAGAAATGGWSLTQSGSSTFTGPWTFSNNTSSVISSLFINAITGKTVFDIFSSSPSTPGSDDGNPFTYQSGVNPSSFQYGNLVNVIGSAPVGDLYGDLTLSWRSGFASGSSLRFLADTDNAIAVTDPTNNARPVPVPGFVVGIVLAAGFFSSKEINKRKTKLQETEV